jgi:hypothetical protein
MAQAGNNRVGGEFMVQDSDHMIDNTQPADQATRKVRQVEQTQSAGRQQGSDRNSDRRRQAH